MLGQRFQFGENLLVLFLRDPSDVISVGEGLLSGVKRGGDAPPLGPRLVTNGSGAGSGCVFKKFPPG